MGLFTGRYKGSSTSHTIKAKSSLEAKAKMLKGTKRLFSEVTIKKVK